MNFYSFASKIRVGFCAAFFFFGFIPENFV